jgi:hypothetical protein
LGCTWRAISTKDAAPSLARATLATVKRQAQAVATGLILLLFLSFSAGGQTTSTGFPNRPLRIIMPGEASATAGEPAAGELASDGAPPPPPGGSRIVLPPGVAREEPEDLPEYPRLRPLEILAVREGDRDLLLVNDPLGVMPAPIALKIDALDMLRVLDGSFSLNDLAAEVVRASKDLRAGSYVKEFVAQLDRMLMLDSPAHEAFKALRDGYHRLEGATGRSLLPWTIRPSSPRSWTATSRKPSGCAPRQASRWRRPMPCHVRCWPPTSIRAAPAPRSRAPISSSAWSAPGRCG